MSLVELVPLVLKTSIMVMVFTIGLTASPRDLIYLFSRPGRLTLSLGSMFVVIVALVVFVVVGLAAGRLLGGPDPDDRTVLAFAPASRHPGIAASLAALNFPQEKATVAVLLLYLIVSALLTIPYVNWRKRAGAAPLKLA